MGTFVRLLVAGLLLLLVLAIPVFLLGWWGHDAWQRHEVMQQPARQATVLRKTQDWGGRAVGRRYVAQVALAQPAPGGAPGREVAVQVTETEYQALRPGQTVAVRSGAGSPPLALLASARWWTWPHVWWLTTGLFLLGYFVKRLFSLFRPTPPTTTS